MTFSIQHSIKGRVLTGAVLFIDIDQYMEAVCKLSLTEECRYAFKIYSIVDSISAMYGLVFVRSFGDAFLLYVEGEINSATLDRCLKFLVKLNDCMAKEGFTFKASLIAGNFYCGRRQVKGSDSETLLCGHIVNFAGKVIKKIKMHELSISWDNQSSCCYEDLLKSGNLEIIPISGLNEKLLKM